MLRILLLPTTPTGDRDEIMLGVNGVIGPNG